MTAAQYVAYLKGEYKPNPHPQMPHCDGYVLHAPGECEYCDAHTDWQQARFDSGINFTGHRKDGYAPCPAEQRRSAATINLWGGNRPTNVAPIAEIKTDADE